jgi:predicted nucleic acid-binding protein
MASRALVLDANIVIRAVLGTRVRRILEKYSERATFFLPESAYLEAEEHLAVLISDRGGDPAKGMALLRAIVSVIDLVSAEVYGSYEAEARRRIGTRDPDDWPILASALTFSCPIWTEDTDFFGCGVATWTSNRVEIFLSD